MATVTVTTRSQILRYTASFISGVLSQPELRRRLIATLLNLTPITNQLTLKHLNLAADSLERAISLSTPALRSSSLSLAEKLLLPLPEYPISSFLLSLILSLCNRPDESATSLLRIFHSIPSLARSEIAPSLYERLFSLHLLPIFWRFDQQRSQILSHDDTGDYSDSDYSSAVLPSAKLLSKMSGDQASKVRELEREYSEVLDENCRILAEYFKEVLVNRDGDATSISPPLLILKSAAEDGGREKENRKEQIPTEPPPVLQNGRYNVM